MNPNGCSEAMVLPRKMPSEDTCWALAPREYRSGGGCAAELRIECQRVFCECVGENETCEVMESCAGKMYKCIDTWKGFTPECSTYMGCVRDNRNIYVDWKSCIRSMAPTTSCDVVSMCGGTILAGEKPVPRQLEFAILMVLAIGLTSAVWLLSRRSRMAITHHTRGRLRVAFSPPSHPQSAEETPPPPPIIVADQIFSCCCCRSTSGGDLVHSIVIPCGCGLCLKCSPSTDKPMKVCPSCGDDGEGGVSMQITLLSDLMASRMNNSEFGSCEDLDDACRILPNRPSSRDCVVCFDAPTSVAFLPCKHLASCHPCALKICNGKAECHICREPIVASIELSALASREVANPLCSSPASPTSPISIDVLIEEEVVAENNKSLD